MNSQDVDVLKTMLTKIENMLRVAEQMRTDLRETSEELHGMLRELQPLAYEEDQ